MSNLVLGRFIGESIMIGENIEITIVKVNNRGNVRLGINAPKSISIHRKEVYRRIKREESR